MDKKYSTADMAKILGVNVRTVQRRLATLRDNLSPKDNLYNTNVLNLLKHSFIHTLNDTETTPNDTKRQEYDRTEYFSEEEYQEFQKRLIEYPMLLDKVNLLIKELEYHKNLLEINLKNHNDLISTIKERNYIEAKEKNLDK